MPSIAKAYGCHMYSNAMSIANSPLYVGLECEIESIANHGDTPESFSVTQDGSLRNNGFEYISKPLQINEAVSAFKDLHCAIEFNNTEEKFSDRTSIHVHVNCCNIEMTEVRNIILMYSLFEEYFFRLVAPDRRHNIHCVPLTETYLPSFYGHDLSTLVSRWHKYTALNIKPLSEQGTIEFRHMQGHDDPQLLADWLGSINNLVITGRRYAITKESLTPENMKLWFNTIFCQTPLAPMAHTIPVVAFHNILDLKMAVL